MTTRPMFKSHSSFPPPDPANTPSGRPAIRAHRNSFVSHADEEVMFEQAAQAADVPMGPSEPSDLDAILAGYLKQ